MHIEYRVGFSRVSREEFESYDLESAEFAPGDVARAAHGVVFVWGPPYGSQTTGYLVGEFDAPIGDVIARIPQGPPCPWGKSHPRIGPV